MEKSTDVPVQPGKRDFLKWLIGSATAAWVVSVTYPILSFLKPPKQGEVEVSSVKAGKLSDIEKDSGMIVKFGNKPVILIRKADGELKAFSGTCTHLDCTVQYRKDFGSIWCACHNGKYDLNGSNISGPPPKPLDEYKVIIKDDEIFISKST
ncbi:Rieske (2Fe-2S) protein [bacterium]|nr:Rieske (2Fe-2S) protein [bacterium]